MNEQLFSICNRLQSVMNTDAESRKSVSRADVKSNRSTIGLERRLSNESKIDEAKERLHCDQRGAIAGHCRKLLGSPGGKIV